MRSSEPSNHRYVFCVTSNLQTTAIFSTTFERYIEISANLEDYGVAKRMSTLGGIACSENESNMFFELVSADVVNTP